MKIARQPQARLRARLAAHHRHRQSRQQVFDAKTPVEAIRRFGQVAAGVFGLADDVVGAAKEGLDFR